MWGFQAAGAAPIVLGHPVDEPETIATAIRIGNPASWRQAQEARDDSGGVIESVTDEEILAAHRLLSSTEGVFVEPASAASVAGPVSYTHLDVYKRQGSRSSRWLCSAPDRRSGHGANGLGAVREARRRAPRARTSGRLGFPASSLRS